MNETDPTGLSDGLPGSLGAPDSHYGLFEGGPDDMSIGAPDDSWIEKGLELDTRTRTRSGTWVWTPDPTEDEPGHGSWGVVWGPWSDWTVISRTPLGLAENESYQRPGESNAHYFWRGVWWVFKQFVTLQPAPGEGGNPFKGKSPSDIDKALRAKGDEPKGDDPVSGKGGYVNPRTGRSLRIDPANKYGEPPHVDINRPRGYNGPLIERKFDL